MQRTEQFLDRYREFAAENEPSTDRARPLTALAIDGGGVRGLVPAMLLAEIERRTETPIWRSFDLIAGTSTGGLLALALTAPGGDGDARWSAEELVQLYRGCGRTIFRRSLLRVPLTQLVFNKYTAGRLEHELAARLGKTMLSESLKPVIVTSWNLSENQPAYFNSAEVKRRDWDLPMRKVARATAAAPTFFEPCWIRNPEHSGREAFVDGGVFANNPAKIAYLSFGPTGPTRPLLLLSLGTGDPMPLKPRPGRRMWGMLPWATPMLHLFMSAPSELVDVELRELEGPNLRYFRLAPDPGCASPHLDCAKKSNIVALERAAQELIAENSEALDEICETLSERA